MEDLSRLIGQIYDTVTDPTLWPKVLGEIATFAEASRTLLILEESANPLRSVFYTSAADPEWIGLYMEHYLLINPMRLAAGDSATTGDVLLTTDFMTTQEYGRSRFAREFLAQRQMVDVAAAVLEKTASSITVLSLQLDERQGFADEEIRRKLTLLAPHVRRAITIGHAFEEKALLAAALAETMDGLAGTVILLDAMAGIVHANAAAHALLAQKDVLRQIGNTLVPFDPMARSALMEALASAQQGDSALGTRGTSIAFTTGRDRALIGTIMPLTDGARRPAGMRYQAVAALCIREATFETPSNITLLERLYNLTKRETTVLLTIIENSGVREAAAVLGLSQGTIKTHLKSLFAKTGAKRQTDLVKLVAGVASPFRPLP